MAGLILGSSSRYRRELLERLRVPFTVVAPDVDETPAKASGAQPQSIVAELARSKARAVHELHPKSVVIGCDQAAVLESQLLDKPHTEGKAIEQLRQLRGREHRLITSVAIAHDDGMVEFTDITRLAMRELSDAEIERYVQNEQPLDCAGSYMIEGLGISLFDRIDTRDHTAIVGLPLMQLCTELRRLGVALP